MDELNPVAIAQRRPDTAAKRLGLDAAAHAFLRRPLKELLVSIPRQMDGRMEVFRGFRCAVGILLLISAFCVNVAEAATGVSDQCRALAELYARAPDRFTPQGRAALQACLAADRAGVPGPIASPGTPDQHPQRAWGEWPPPAPWTSTSEPWPDRPWDGESQER